MPITENVFYQYLQLTFINKQTKKTSNVKEYGAVITPAITVFNIPLYQEVNTEHCAVADITFECE